MNLRDLKFQQANLSELQRGEKFMFENGQLPYVFEGHKNGKYWYTWYEKYVEGVRNDYSTPHDATVDLITNW